MIFKVTFILRRKPRYITFIDENSLEETIAIYNRHKGVYEVGDEFILLTRDLPTIKQLEDIKEKNRL